MRSIVPKRPEIVPTEETTPILKETFTAGIPGPSRQAVEKLVWHDGNSVVRASEQWENVRQDTQSLSSKAAASEGPRRYIPHVVWVVRPCIGLGERKSSLK